MRPGARAMRSADTKADTNAHDEGKMRIPALALKACLGLLWLTGSFNAGAAAPAAAVETLKIGGTGAALGTMKQIGAEFAKTRPGVQIEVLPYIGSTGAIKGVANNAIAIGLSGRPLKPEEQKQKIRLLRYAATPLVIAVHPDVKQTSVTRAQLAALYAGTQTKWDDGKPVRIILRPAKETDHLVLRTFAPEVSAGLDAALARKGIHSAPTDQEAVDAIEATPGSVGTSTLSLLVSEQRKARVLALDGLKPSVKALANGSYPYQKSLYLVVPHTPSASVQAFVDFVFSSRGQALLTANAQLPLRD
jgi:phosphate transport system substrate-binding protein